MGFWCAKVIPTRHSTHVRTRASRWRRRLADYGAHLALAGLVQRNPTNGRQGKSAACGRAQVVGRVGSFRRSGAPAGWRLALKGERLQRPQRHRAILLMTKAKPKPKTTRRKASLADRSCEAVKALTPEHRPALWVRPMTIRAKATPPPDLSKDRPHQASTEHHTRCPICGHVVERARSRGGHGAPRAGSPGAEQDLAPALEIAPR
jgi:ParB-like chromosome segregation protein Spo0J